MQTTVVNLWGGPGSGKSTLAADLFVTGKQSGIIVELVQEAAKESAWHNQAIVQADVFFEQARRVMRLLGKVEIVYTDSPIELSAFYTNHYGDPAAAKIYQDLAKAISKSIIDQGHVIQDIWVDRNKPYQALGRFETEEEAKRIDIVMKEFFHQNVKRNLTGGII